MFAPFEVAAFVPVGSMDFATKPLETDLLLEFAALVEDN